MTEATKAKPLTMRMHDRDNVTVVLNDGGLAAGAVIDEGITLPQHVPQGHKIALVDLKPGDAVRRYNVTIGYALDDLPKGSWLNEFNLRMPEAPVLSDLPIATMRESASEQLDGYTFEGFRNPDGSVGTRNILAITTTVQCVSGVVEHAVSRIKSDLLPRFAYVDDVVGLEHTYGCGVAIDAPGASIPIKTLRNISRNPNLTGSSMVVSLGCEKLQPDRLFKDVQATADMPDIMTLQDDRHIGFEQMISSIMTLAEGHLEQLNARRRETCPASDLVVGLQCGGSDALSGITANPALGFATDLLVRAGATVLFSEVTEVRDGIGQLTARAANADVAKALMREMAWYDAYLEAGSVDRSANTTPGNKKGGLSNIVEKAMGSIVKSGSATITGVVPPGERALEKGLLFNATPASDFICGTLQLAAGMNLHVFTTGRGTPYGLAEVPVVKVATRSDLKRRWHDLIDVDAGRIADGTATIESVGWELFRLLLDTASGKPTSAERLKLKNALALFNPGPVT